MSDHVVVATHGHCFDGLCAASLFTRLLRHIEPGRHFEFTYRAMGYGPGENGVDPAVLTGAENAILDYRYTETDRLTWYFDHHVSAFVSPEDRARFDERTASKPRRMFHDGKYGSCTKLIADIGEAQFSLPVGTLRPLVDWAEMIDTASFPNAQMAVLREEPVLQLMTVVENQGDTAFIQRMAERLLVENVEDLARSAEVLSAYGPLKKNNEAFLEAVRSKAKENGKVVFVDLGDSIVEVAAKFVTYALFPTSIYSVYLTRSASKCKISVGYNPWCGSPRSHNIAAICERYGGGGHPVVGAISTKANEVARARQIMAEVVEELSAR